MTAELAFVFLSPAPDGGGASVPQAARSTRRPGDTLRSAVSERLGSAILSGRYAPGDLLSGEIASSDALAVSRSAYREAVKALTAKGLVESRPKIGTRVLPRARWNVLDLDVLAWAFAGNPDPDLVRSLFELRMMIEPAAVGFAATRRDEADVMRISDALRRMSHYGLADAKGRAADRDFHDALFHAAGNDILIVLGASIGTIIDWTTRFKQQTGALRRNPHAEHAAVYDAVAAGDAAAATTAMRLLVELAWSDMREVMPLIG